MSTVTLRLVRLAVLLTLLGGSLAGTAPRTRAADGLAGDTYTSDTYGWSIAFDDGVWDATEVDERASQGVALSSDAAFANFVVYDDGITDAQACLDDLDRALTSSDTWDGLSPTNSLDAPKTGRGALGEIYTGILKLDNGDLDAALYLECREVHGATLSVSVTAVQDAYATTLPDIEDLLAGIDTGGSTTQDTPTKTPTGGTSPTRRKTPTPASDQPSGTDVQIPDGLDGGTYGNADHGLLIEFDDSEWTAKELDQGIGIFLSRDVPNALSVGQVQIRTDVDASDVDACLADLGDELGTLDGIADVAKSRTLEAPGTDRDAAGAVYEYTFTTTDGTDLPLVSYLECRQLGQDAALRVELTADQDSYPDQVDDFTDFLTGIQVVPAGSASAGKKTPTPSTDGGTTPARRKTPTPTGDTGTTENDVAAGELAGDTFTDSALGYAFTFDDRTWTAELLKDSATAGVFLSTDDQDLFATVTLDGSLGYDGVDADRCVSDYADSLETLDGYSSLREERTIDVPTPPRGAAGAVYSYTYTYADDTTADLVAYVACLPISSEAMVRINIQTTEESLGANADAFQELVDGIAIDAGNASDDTSNADDSTLGPDETATPDDPSA